jgi:hypothetical protein
VSTETFDCRMDLSKFVEKHTVEMASDNSAWVVIQLKYMEGIWDGWVVFFCHVLTSVL